LDEEGGIGDFQDADELGGTVKSGVALGIGGAFFHEDLARARDGLEADGINAEAVLQTFSDRKSVV